MFCITIEHKNAAVLFAKILLTFCFGYLYISGHFSQKQSQLVETSMFICMQNMSSLPNFLFWDVVKILQTYYFEYFQNAWSYPAVMIVSPSRHLWCPKCWNQPAGNFDVHLQAKNAFSSYLLFWYIVKAL